MKLKVLNSLRLGREIAAEVPASQSNHRAWIGVYPLKGGRQEYYVYRVRLFEVDEKYLEDDNDVWEETIKIKKDFIAEDEEDLINKLEKIIDTDLLDDPWKCDYPI